jgi:hypothetical protein
MGLLIIEFGLCCDCCEKKRLCCVMLVCSRAGFLYGFWLPFADELQVLLIGLDLGFLERN